MPIGEIILVIFIIAFVIFQIGAFYIALLMTHPKRFSLLESRLIEENSDAELMKYYDTWDVNEFDLPTEQGYTIKLYDITPKEKTNQIIIIAHGYTYTHHGSIKYARYFYDRGFRVILYDQRYHGKSQGKSCSMGFYEKFDLKNIVTYVKKQYGPEMVIGTYGESMGAATVLLEQEIDDRVAYVIADCPFADLEQLVLYLYHRKLKYGGKLILPFIQFYFYILSKAKMNQIKPIQAVEKAKVPILFFHGENDTFIPPSNTANMVSKYNGEKMVYYGENKAKHAESILKNKEQYLAVLNEFINQYIVEKPRG